MFNLTHRLRGCQGATAIHEISGLRHDHQLSMLSELCDFSPQEWSRWGGCCTYLSTSLRSFWLKRWLSAARHWRCRKVPEVGARRLGQDEQYLTVREILSEASTLVPPWAGLSCERSDYYRFGYATLGLSIWVTVFRLWRSSQGWFHELK